MSETQLEVKSEIPINLSAQIALESGIKTLPTIEGKIKKESKSSI